MFAKLFWKEWKENLWKLMFCCVAGVGFTAILFRMRIIPDQTNKKAGTGRKAEKGPGEV